MSVAFHLGEIPDSFEKGVRYTGSSAAPQSYFPGRIVLYTYIEYPGTPFHYLFKVGSVVVFHGASDAESGTKGSREKTASCGRSDKSERIEGNADRTGTGTFVDHDVNHVILHRGIKVFLNFRGKSVDLIDEKDITGFQGREKACKITRLVKDGAGSYLHVYPQLIGYDMGEGSLSKTGRTVKEDVVQ